MPFFSVLWSLVGDVLQIIAFIALALNVLFLYLEAEGAILYITKKV